METQAERVIRIAASAEELSRLAAEEFVRLAMDTIGKKPVFVVSLAGGSTPRTLYQLLADSSEPFREQLPWEKIHFFWGDERHVGPDNPASNYRLARETMLEHVSIPVENVHRIKSEMPNAAEAADVYERELRYFFKAEAGQLPRFDLILLGMGSDGHTASIFPGSEVISEKHRLVMAPWVEALDSYRITLTPLILNNAASLIFLVIGEDKAKTLRQVLHGAYHPEQFPAQVIKPRNGNLLWLVDPEAGSLLQGPQKTSRSPD